VCCNIKPIRNNNVDDGVVMYHEPEEEPVDDDRFAKTKSANYGSTDKKNSDDEEFMWEIK